MSDHVGLPYKIEASGVTPIGEAVIIDHRHRDGIQVATIRRFELRVLPVGCLSVDAGLVGKTARSDALENQAAGLSDSELRS